MMMTMIFILFTVATHAKTERSSCFITGVTLLALEIQDGGRRHLGKILTIGSYLTKIWTKLCGLLFLGHHVCVWEI